MDHEAPVATPTATRTDGSNQPTDDRLAAFKRGAPGPQGQSRAEARAPTETEAPAETHPKHRADRRTAISSDAPTGADGSTAQRAPQPAKQPQKPREPQKPALRVPNRSRPLRRDRDRGAQRRVRARLQARGTRAPRKRRRRGGRGRGGRSGGASGRRRPSPSVRGQTRCHRRPPTPRRSLSATTPSPIAMKLRRPARRPARRRHPHRRRRRRGSRGGSGAADAKTGDQRTSPPNEGHGRREKDGQRVSASGQRDAGQRDGKPARSP